MARDQGRTDQIDAHQLGQALCVQIAPGFLRLQFRPVMEHAGGGDHQMQRAVLRRRAGGGLDAVRFSKIGGQGARAGQALRPARNREERAAARIGAERARKRAAYCAARAKHQRAVVLRQGCQGQAHGAMS